MDGRIDRETEPTKTIYSFGILRMSGVWPRKWHMRTAKTQISLGIYLVWSVFAVYMKKAWVLSYSLSTQQRLIWAESSLGVHAILLGLSLDGVSIKTIGGYSLEAPQEGTSNEYPYSIGDIWRYKKNIGVNTSLSWAIYILYLLLVLVCLCWGFMAQSTQWDHVEHNQFT